MYVSHAQFILPTFRLEQEGIDNVTHVTRTLTYLHMSKSSAYGHQALHNIDRRPTSFNTIVLYIYGQV
jgi:hypothetical protein